MYLLITQRPEIAKMLQYSENVEIRNLRKERADMNIVSKEELLEKFKLK
jgi:hypothetical protein